MRRGGDKGVWTGLEPLYILSMKGLYGSAESIRTFPYIIQGNKSVINIKGSIFESFSHNRTCNLLESHNEIKPFLFIVVPKIFRILEQQDILKEIKNRHAHGRVLFLCLRYCQFYIPAVPFGYTRRLYIRSVYREKGDNLFYNYRKAV